MIDQPPLPSPDALFDDAPCGLVVTREDGTILRSNLIFSNWVGISPADLLHQRFQDLLTMGGRIFHQTHWAPLMQMQGSVAEVKLELRHVAGHSVTMLLNGVRREHAGGAVHEMALFGTHDRDRYEKELLQARNRAEELLREKTAAETALKQAKAELVVAYEKSHRRALFAEQMVAIASHDLKNPLTAIRMASDVLAQGERSEKEAKLLGHISQSAERAKRMISDLLDFAQARVGQGIGVIRRSVDLHELVVRSVNELRVAFPRATLVHRYEGNASISLDADRLQQIIGNLVANSVAYGDLLRPITIVSDLSGESAKLSVHNEGTPIPEAAISGLFEPMTRGSELAEDVRSIGLGLFIVMEIAKAHCGDVTARSSAAGGTTFTVSFPLGDSEGRD